MHPSAASQSRRLTTASKQSSGLSRPGLFYVLDSNCALEPRELALHPTKSACRAAVADDAIKPPESFFEMHLRQSTQVLMRS
jgi:hypothetical protein